MKDSLRRLLCFVVFHDDPFWLMFLSERKAWPWHIFSELKRWETEEILRNWNYILYGSRNGFNYKERGRV